jgi:hypothetical protein
LEYGGFPAITSYIIVPLFINITAFSAIHLSRGKRPVFQSLKQRYNGYRRLNREPILGGSPTPNPINNVKGKVSSYIK